MIRVLFWNLGNRRLEKYVVRLIRENNIDIAVFAEYAMDSQTLLRSINKKSIIVFRESLPVNSRLRILSKYTDRTLIPIRDDSCLSVRNLVPKVGQELLVVGLHLPSRMYRSDSELHSQAQHWARIIAETEEKVGHDRTLLVGDFNMSPFHDGMIDPLCFNAVNDRQIALRGERTVGGKAYKYFYNPMWNYFGDGPPLPQGTFYYDKRQITPHWHLFDQVLVRPSLSARMDTEHVRIVTEIDTETLLDGRGRPDGTRVSDHLPIIVGIDDGGFGHAA